MNDSLEAARSARPGRAGWLLLMISAAIMAWNTFAHAPAAVYDSRHHVRLIEANADPLDWRPHAAEGLFDHLPVLYYAVLGKLHRLVEAVSGLDFHPFYFFRLIHLLAILGMVGLLAFDLLPRMAGATPAGTRAFIAAALLIPNLYLSQVMIRSDHFVALFAQLLFYLWFRFEFPGRLAESGWRRAAWAVLLVAMANSRNFSLPAFVVFFAWGGLVLLWDARRRRGWGPRVGAAALLALVAGLSSVHYAMRYARTGRLFEQTQTSDRFARYQERAKGFDRRLLFLNFQFDRVLANPTREVRFEATKAWPARRLNIPTRDATFEDDNNALFPRLYADMWGDHWLYFSGSRIRRLDESRVWSHKLPLKRVVLVAAAPFTLMYVLVPLAMAASGLLGLARGQRPSAGQTAASIFVLAFGLLAVWVAGQPEPGINTSVKFCYLGAFAVFPLIAIYEGLLRHPRIARWTVLYVWGLWALCLPLAVFVP